MKPPTTPSLFRAPVRHYHRHHNGPGASWDAWVGAEEKKKFRFVLPLLTILILLVISALLVIAYAMI